AKSGGGQAEHPGYGSLSERAAFAGACADAGLVFIGPPAQAIRAMGDKTEARRRMQAAGVPVVPGTAAPLRDPVEARREAKRIGYPVLLKAVAGGGGKGMRLVGAESDVEGAFQAARREALKAFGDGSIYAEKYLQRPRHIEIQVLADQHGKVITLGERECSIQRRHQKLLEESPSTRVTPKLRKQIGDKLESSLTDIGYQNAGTIEFLMDEDGSLHFIEMNTRIQVEHPVTEMVTGVDLVKAQIRIAAGEKLSEIVTAPIEMRGHSIECRIN